jgi:hypothetical protein
MRKLVIILLAAFVMAGCSDIRFDKMPGVYQDLIPVEIQGKYVYYSKDFRSKLLDTMLLNVSHNEITIDGSYGETKLSIHQNFKLNKIGDLYVVGTQDKVLKSLWNLFVIEPTSKGFNFYSVHEKSIKSNPENKLDAYFPFFDVPFTYEPIPAEPMVIGDGGGGQPGTPNMLRYYSMSDEQFKLYFENELKNKDYIPFKKDSKEKSKKSK